jgi:hypothetical protein
MIPTTEKLALALEKINAPAEMIRAARAGRYDDFKSESTTPILDLMRDLKKIGALGLATRALKGEFDATKEEADAWYEKEGRHVL